MCNGSHGYKPEFVRSLSTMNMENPAATVAEDATEDFAALFEAQEAKTVRLQAGQKVTGTVIEITADAVLVDVGSKVDGVMDRKDILDAEGQEIVKAGDTLDAWVVAVKAHEIRLSRSASGSGVAALEDARDAGLPVDGRVTATCKGGFTVDVMGKRAFCPGSQMDIAQAEAESVVGRTLQFLITKVESYGRNIVVSRRALLERERRETLAKVLEEVHAGDVVEGRITRLAPFGAFMEIAPAVEGMIHISELSWARIARPEDAVSVGDTVQAKILSIAEDAKGNTRISLSCKQAAGDPWADVEGRLAAGSVVEGRVVRLTPFGAFVEVLPGVEGLVHISEMSWSKRVVKAEDVLHVNDVVSVKIKDISLEKRRISLSLRDAEGDPWAEVATTFPVGAVVTGEVESQSKFGVFVTLAPSITGLLPMGIIKTSKKADLTKLQKGDSVTLVIQNVDVAARRISLAPEGYEAPAAAPRREREDSSWKEHTSAGAGGMNIMANALQAALSRKSK